MAWNWGRSRASGRTGGETGMAQREDLEKCQRMEGEDLLMPTRILFRLEIRKYLGLFYIAPSFWKREKETAGEGDGERERRKF